jgi:hypothetical protein
VLTKVSISDQMNVMHRVMLCGFLLREDASNREQNLLNPSHTDQETRSRTFSSYAGR